MAPECPTSTTQPERWSVVGGVRWNHDGIITTPRTSRDVRKMVSERKQRKQRSESRRSLSLSPVVGTVARWDCAERPTHERVAAALPAAASEPRRAPVPSVADGQFSVGANTTRWRTRLEVDPRHGSVGYPHHPGRKTLLDGAIKTPADLVSKSRDRARQPANGPFYVVARSRDTWRAKSENWSLHANTHIHIHPRPSGSLVGNGPHRHAGTHWQKDHNWRMTYDSKARRGAHRAKRPVNTSGEVPLRPFLGWASEWRPQAVKCRRRSSPIHRRQQDCPEVARGAVETTVYLGVNCRWAAVIRRWSLCNG